MRKRLYICTKLAMALARCGDDFGADAFTGI
jgi:hypothetical protein